MNISQPQTMLFDLSDIEKHSGVFPSTRYQGSKSKLIDWIKYYTQNLEFDTVLDAFGGTGSVAYMYKQLGKRVLYNDVLKFNYYIGLALIENKKEVLNEEDVAFILTKNPKVKYPDFIQNTFKDIYFTDEENAWLDIISTNIECLHNIYKKALAYFALFQACIIKRPYNLFHRKNLYIRLANIERSFGNKKTWDTPFKEHFRTFVEMANKAVFDNHKKNEAYCSDVVNFKTPGKIDLVYIDTPYISERGVGVNYFEFYHFLEGIVDYKNWSKKIDQDSKHKRIKNGKDQWSNKNEIKASFEQLFNKFKDSILVVSYRDNGVPSIPELERMLLNNKDKVEVKKIDYKYVLSNQDNMEALLIAR